MRGGGSAPELVVARAGRHRIELGAGRHGGGALGRRSSGRHGRVVRAGARGSARRVGAGAGGGATGASVLGAARSGREAGQRRSGRGSGGGPASELWAARGGGARGVATMKCCVEEEGVCVGRRKIAYI